MNQYTPWTPEQDARLVAMSSANCRLAEIASAIGRPIKSVADRRRKLKVVKQRRRVERAVAEIASVTPRRERSEIEFADWCIRIQPGLYGVKVSAGMVPA